MKYFRIVFVVLAVAALASCATRYRVDTDYNDEYSFLHKKNFTIQTPDLKSEIPQDLLKGRIEKFITAALKLRGFNRVEREKADILVSYFFTTQEKQDIVTYNSFYNYHHCYYCYGFGIDTVHTRDYQEGTLIIDIVDPATQTIKWRGSTSARLHQRTPEQKDQLFKDVVTAILSKYPPHEKL